MSTPDNVISLISVLRPEAIMQVPDWELEHLCISALNLISLKFGIAFGAPGAINLGTGLPYFRYRRRYTTF